MSGYDQGRTKAMRVYGVTKVAGFWDVAKNIAIGDPGKFTSQLREGTIMKPGGVWREAFVPTSLVGKALTYGFPAYSIYDAIKNPSPQPGTQMGSLVGSILGGTLGLPLGIAGNMIGSTIGARAGSTVGSLFDKKPPLRHKSSLGPRLSQRMSEVTGRPV